MHPETSQEVVASPEVFLRETASLYKDISNRYFELAARLSHIRGQHLWKNGYESFSDYLDDTKISQATASKLIQVYESYILPGHFTPMQLDGTPYSSLYEAIPLLKQHNPQEVVEMAKRLTRDEIKSEVKDDKHPDCEHVQTIVICVKCHRRVEE